MSMSANLPLAGIRVLDLTRALAGPFCTMILADLGADVIKVEPLDGDMIREWGPHDRGESAYYLSGNRNKRGMAVNFRSAEGLALLKELAGECDVVAENFRPGSAKEMGLDYESIAATNPGVVYASITGFGNSGPAGKLPGFDQIAQGYSGLMSVTGTPESGPVRVGVAIGDQTAGMWAALGTLAALYERRATGKGRLVETSLLASLVSLLSVQGQRYLSLGDVPGPTGNTHPVISPYGVFCTADGPLNIAPATRAMWEKLCAVLAVPQLLTDPRFADNAARVNHRAELKALLEEQLMRETRGHWTEALCAAGIPAGPINTLEDVFRDAQVVHCRLVEQIEHPTLGPMRMVGSPIRMKDAPHATVRMPPPLLGEHTVQLLEEFGYSSQEIGAMANEGVIAGVRTGVSALA
jgi:crotonobetainyl-CoA:carnitine CoA-transferase CaiB-like acyl-CoA transferase